MLAVTQHRAFCALFALKLSRAISYPQFTITRKKGAITVLRPPHPTSSPHIVAPLRYPTELDVRPFCTADAVRDLSNGDGGDSAADSGTYLLYAAVLHSGGAGGGHYTALVRDFRGEGSWAAPTEAKEDEGDDAEGATAGTSDASTAAESEWITVGKKSGDSDGDGSNDDGSSAPQPPGKWFYVNDERVTCATERDLEKA